MCQYGTNRNPWAGYRMDPSPTAHVPLTPNPGGSKTLPFKLQPNRRPHDVGLSSGLITIVVMTLCVMIWRCFCHFLGLFLTFAVINCLFRIDRLIFFVD